MAQNTADALHFCRFECFSSGIATYQHASKHQLTVAHSRLAQSCSMARYWHLFISIRYDTAKLLSCSAPMTLPLFHRTQTRLHAGHHRDCVTPSSSITPPRLPANRHPPALQSSSCRYVTLRCLARHRTSVAVLVRWPIIQLQRWVRPRNGNYLRTACNKTIVTLLLGTSIMAAKLRGACVFHVKTTIDPTERRPEIP
ncbi:hypothetical protein B0O95_1295 [Mycetohabitans endofungorum]|uniref:Uncharacterized protein n=1 Tax=Mycetohabitans endofungorum TaxID=417203 RepID=A0A2P5K6L6_9BURK|nr:hypothetical protein B0O95_1295 [Mycetohabitans endofungorum]WPC94904.1 Orf1 [Mycetohabitans endofungorum]